jgi:hypothetical protein
MHIQAKILPVAVLTLALASVARSDLVFEQTQLELHPAAGDETAVGHFKYQNKGDKPIAIKSVTTSCGCTAASAKNTADPGEKGEVTATFKIGDRVGTQQKAITVTTDDATHPTQTLMLKVVIPQVLELQPTFVLWQSGEATKPKTIVAKAGKDISIKNLEVASSSPEFTAKTERGSAAGEFRINIEPKQTKQAAATTLTIKTTLPNGKPKQFYASARVMPPAPAPGQSVTPASRNVALASPPKGAANPPKTDACSLLTTKEIESVQGEALKEPKSTGQTGGGFAVSQCYFALPTASNSISLTLTQRSDGPDARDPKEFWKDTFHKEKGEDKEHAGREEREREATPPEKVDGVGDEAFWLSNRVGGDLYVLKGNSFFRISVGGAGDKTAKMDKSKKLAEMILKRI